MNAKRWSVAIFAVFSLFLVAGVGNCVSCYRSTCAKGLDVALVNGVCMCVQRPEGYER